MGVTGDLQRPAPAQRHHRCMQTTRTSHLRLASGRRLHARRQRNLSHASTSPCCDSRPGASEPSRDPSLPPDVPRAVPPATWNPFKNTKKEASLHTNGLSDTASSSASCYCLAYATATRQPRCNITVACWTDHNQPTPSGLAGCSPVSTARYVQGQG